MAEASSTDDVLTLRIRFKSETLERFIERYGGDLGPDEVFVRTRQPLAIGTPLAFEFTLADGSALLSGRGTVTWLRGEADVAGPPGMGVRFTSLPAASWQVLRRILAASGRGEPALPGGPAAARRIAPLGAPPLAVPDRSLEQARTTPQARYVPEGRLNEGRLHDLKEDREDNERTEVARVPPNFFELANEPARNERPRPQPARRAPEPETVENLALDEMDDITTTVPRPGLHRLNPPTTRDPSGPWRLPTGPGGDSGPISLGRSSAVPAYQGTTPVMGVRESPLESRGPLGEPVSSTAPTLPATAAVLLYDPDDPKQHLQPADQARPAAAPSTPLPATQSSPLVVPPLSAPPSYQPNFYAPPPPPADSGAYPDANFDPTRYAGSGRPTGPRSTVGRIGPAISPEEMALASSAVRGLEGEAPMWPGLAPEEPPRGSTAKIWIALTLAAAGVIALFLVFFPLLSQQSGPESAGVTAPAGEAPAPGTPPAMVPPTTAPATPAAGTPATPPAATPPAEPAAAAPAAAPAPVKEAPGRPGRASRGDEVTPPLRARRRRRNPADVIADAEARAAARAEAATPDPAAAAPSEPAPATSPPAVPAPAVGEGPPVVEPSEDAYWLSVRSTPSGADVYVDGQFEGKTPFQRRIFDPARTYTLSVRKPGFTTVDRTVTAGSDWARRGNVRTHSVTAKLEPIGGEEVPAPAIKTNPFDEPTPAAPATGTRP